jgi:hypothetical protein
MRLGAWPLVLVLCTSQPSQEHDAATHAGADHDLAAPPKLTLRGFTNVDYLVNEEGKPDSFALGQFDLFVTSALSENWSFLAEVNFEALTMAELSRIFRMDQQHWRSGGRIDVVLQVSGSEKDAIVVSRVLDLQPKDLQAFWVGKMFRGEIPAAPRSLASDGSVKQYVAGNNHAIGYVDALLLDDTVTALKIDGKGPGEQGYALARH